MSLSTDQYDYTLNSDLPSDVASLVFFDKETIDYVAEIRSTSILAAVEACKSPEQLAELSKLEHGYGIAPPQCDTVEQTLMRLCDAKWWRKKLKRKVLSVKEWDAAIKGHVGAKNEASYVSDSAENLIFYSDRQAEKSLKKRKLVNLLNPEAEHLSLFDVSEYAKEGRMAELYTLSKGLGDYAIKHGLTWCMTTLKLDGEWHPNPSLGKRHYNKASFEDMHAELNHKWQLIRAAAHDQNVKIMGLRVTEAHRDGCPHWHIMVYIKPEHRATWEDIVTHKDRCPGNQSDFNWAWTPEEAAAKGKKVAASASYLLKYIVKAVATDEKQLADFDTKDDLKDHMAPRVIAKRRCHGWRAFQFFGIKSSMTAWRMMRSSTTEPTSEIGRELYKAANAGNGLKWLELMNGDQCPRFSPFYIKTDRIGRYGEVIERLEGAILVDHQSEILDEFRRIRRFELNDLEAIDEVNKRYRETVSTVISNCARRAKSKSGKLVFFDGGWYGVEHKMDDYDEPDPPF